ncbi:hypothetical protein MRX96_048571 [Rhipicephalus microplus]
MRVLKHRDVIGAEFCLQTFVLVPACCPADTTILPNPPIGFGRSIRWLVRLLKLWPRPEHGCSCFRSWLPSVPASPRANMFWRLAAARTLQPLLTRSQLQIFLSGVLQACWLFLRVALPCS